MKRYIYIVLIFVLMFTSFAFAAHPLEAILGVDDETLNAYGYGSDYSEKNFFVVQNLLNPSRYYIYESHSNDLNGFFYVSQTSDLTCIEYNGDSFYKRTYDKSTSVFDSKSRDYGSNVHTLTYLSEEQCKIVYSTRDITNYRGTEVFFSAQPPVTVEDIPQMVATQAGILVGVGILLISLMLLPTLLKKLLNFL
ncbi:hypothetical protein QBE52_04870 [Clostridiaceae bacterium 35-E11]